MASPAFDARLICGAVLLLSSRDGFDLVTGSTDKCSIAATAALLENLPRIGAVETP